MAERNCIVPGCEAPRRTVSYCQSHHRRWKKYGDPLAGRTRNGDPMLFVNAAVNFAKDECLIWPYNRHNGYAVMFRKTRPVVVSRYLCEIVKGAPPTELHQAAHNCGKGKSGCVNPRHLEWKTAAENNADKETHGTALKGEQLSSAKLTAADVLAIRSDPRKHNAIAADYSVSQFTIHAVLKGKRWRHVV